MRKRGRGFGEAFACRQKTRRAAPAQNEFHHGLLGRGSTERDVTAASFRCADASPPVVSTRVRVATSTVTGIERTAPESSAKLRKEPSRSASSRRQEGPRRREETSQTTADKPSPYKTNRSLGFSRPNESSLGRQLVHSDSLQPSAGFRTMPFGDEHARARPRKKRSEN